MTDIDKVDAHHHLWSLWNHAIASPTKELDLHLVRYRNRSGITGICRQQ